MSDPDYRAMWEELLADAESWATSTERIDPDGLRMYMGDMAERHGQSTPDPTHTPAVRRATHWTVGDCTFATPEAAYRHLGSKAAWAALRKIGRRGKYWPCLPVGTADKVGRLIRHRDEKAGWR